MKNFKGFYKIIFVALMMFAVVSCASKYSTDSTMLRGNTLSAVRVSKLDKGEYEFALRSVEKTNFNVLYSKSPYKIVILAPDTVLGEEVLRYKYSDDVVLGLAFIPERSGSRIEILLKENAEYTYTQEGQLLNLRFKPVSRSVSSLESQGVKVDPVSPESAQLASSLRTFKNSSDSSSLRLEFGLDGVARYDFGYLDDKTLYVDFFDVTSSLNTKKYPALGVVSDVQVNEFYPPKKVRFIVKVSSRLPVFAGQNGNQFVVSSNHATAPSESRYISSIDALNYKNIQSIVIKTIGKVVYTKKVVDNALHIEFDSDVKLLSSVQNRFSFNNLPFKTLEILKIDGKLVVVLTPDSDIFARVDETVEGILISGSFKEFSRADMEFTKPVAAAGTKGSKAELVTLNMRQMDVREAIRLIYYGRDKNIIFGEEVTGNVTLYFKDVDYETAIRTILRDRNLTMVEDKGVVWITSNQKYEERQNAETARLRAAQQAKEEAPLRTEIIPVNFSDATQTLGIVRSLLSRRGTAEVDIRTNSFVVRDTDENILEVRKLMQTVDKRTPQVTIEARIVEVSDINALNLGIQWGFSGNTSTNAQFPNQINVGTNAGGGKYMVNVPTTESVGSLALSILNRKGTFGLDIALSALETQNKARTISSPRVTTLDNMEATIKSGGTAKIVPSGDQTQTEETETGIILNVKPQITSNDMIFLDIVVEKSTLVEMTATNVSTTEKKAETKVLLANGETTVIGGLYEDEENNVITGVPGLSKLPVLGYLFKGSQKRVTRRELLVFLTPYVEK